MNLPFGSPVLEAAVRLLSPFILLFAAYVVAHGHVSPGGGFQGGVLLAAALILVNLVHGRGTRWRLPPPASLALASAGVLVYAAIGLASTAFGGAFLDYGALPLALPPAQLRALGSFGIELGVAMAVMGVMALLFDTLMGWEREDGSAP